MEIFSRPQQTSTPQDKNYSSERFFQKNLSNENYFQNPTLNSSAYNNDTNDNTFQFETNNRSTSNNNQLLKNKTNDSINSKERSPPSSELSLEEDLNPRYVFLSFCLILLCLAVSFSIGLLNSVILSTCQYQKTLSKTICMPERVLYEIPYEVPNSTKYLLIDKPKPINFINKISFNKNLESKKSLQDSLINKNIQIRQDKGLISFDLFYQKEETLAKMIFKEGESTTKDNLSGTNSFSKQITNKEIKEENIPEHSFGILQKTNLSRFNKLEELSLIRCGIINLENAVFSNSLHLRSVDLRNNKIMYLNPSSFKNSPLSLVSIDLSSNPLVSLSNRQFQGLTSSHIKLTNNSQLSEIMSEAFVGSAISKITFTSASFQLITRKLLSPIKNFLYYFEISNHVRQLQIEEDAFLGFNLSKLVIKNAGLTHAKFLKYGMFETIILDQNSFDNGTFLNSQENRNDVSILQHYTRHLSLVNCSLSAMPEELLKVFIRIQSLNLSDNQISSISESHFCEMVDLEQLDLSNNRLISIIGKQFNVYLPKLKILRLHNNRLRTLDSSLENLFLRLNELTLRANQFHCNCQMKWLKLWAGKHANQNKNGVGEAAKNLIESINCTTPKVLNVMKVSQETGFQCSRPLLTNHNKIQSTDGTSFTLYCTFFGDPPPTIAWFQTSSLSRGGIKLKRIKNPNSGYEKVLDSLGNEDPFYIVGWLKVTTGGNFTCSGNNQDGKVEYLFKIDPSALKGVKIGQIFPKIELLSNPIGLIITLTLLFIVGYMVKYDED